MLHKTRDVLDRLQIMLINALRAHLGECGIVKAQGPARVTALLALVTRFEKLIRDWHCHEVSDGSLQCRASGQSRHRRWQLPHPTPPSSNPDGLSPQGWDRTTLAGKNALVIWGITK